MLYFKANDPTYLDKINVLTLKIILKVRST